MGLEAINFFFRSEEQIEFALESNKDINHFAGKKYVYKKDNEYWIDLEFQDSYSLSIRITLCNPKEQVLMALDRLLSILFSFKEGRLMDINTKRVYEKYDDEARKSIKESYLIRKKVFEDMYGNYIAAISSEEFYKRQNEIHDRK